MSAAFPLWLIRGKANWYIPAARLQVVRRALIFGNIHLVNMNGKGWHFIVILDKIEIR
jgi:hypothetical protein